jgi:uncharacterized protein
MTTRSRDKDPRRLDVERFAREAAQLEGFWPLKGMPRLIDSCHVEAGVQPESDVVWAARGEQRRVGGELQTWMALRLHARLKLTCQRCLGAVEAPLDIERRFRFVDGEDQAAALDAEQDDDVLARSRAFDLHQLAEDELLLALPIVPMHETCPEPLRVTDAAADEDALPRANPFEALAGLKKAGR